VLPLVQRARLVEPLVALQAQKLGAERGGGRLGELGLADPGRALDQDRPVERVGQKQGGGDRRVGDVAGAAQRRGDLVRAGEEAAHGADPAPLSPLAPEPAPGSGSGGGGSDPASSSGAGCLSSSSSRMIWIDRSAAGKARRGWRRVGWSGAASVSE